MNRDLRKKGEIKINRHLDLSSPHVVYKDKTLFQQQLYRSPIYPTSSYVIR